MRGKFQNGSLAGFIIVGVLLALVVVGGLYGLNRYNAEQAQKEAETALETEEEIIPPVVDGKNTDERPAEEKKAEPAAPQQATSNSSAQASDLPSTGPADTVFGILAVGALAFAGTHYIRSRR